MVKAFFLVPMPARTSTAAEKYQAEWKASAAARYAGVMLITCIMPTAGRRRFIPSALRSFLNQTYDDKELVIVDDGREDPVADLMPDDDRVRYFLAEQVAEADRPAGGYSIGALRNMACRQARGNFVAHFDDDDYSYPDRLADQMATFRAVGNVDLVGYNQMFFIDTRDAPAEPAVVCYGSMLSNYVVGTSFFFARHFWERFPFEDLAVGEDNVFARDARVTAVSAVYPKIAMVARLHEQTSSPKPSRDNITRGNQPSWSLITNPEVIQKVKGLIQL